MPELPEVETIARGVHARLRGDRIVEAWFSSYREPFKTPPRRQARELAGRTILSVHRTGKHIVFELGARSEAGGPAHRGSARVNDAQAQWIVHLGMTGRLLVTAPNTPAAAHTHARLSLKSGLELRFVDPRRFGRLEFRDLAGSERFSGPGAEPLSIAPPDFAALFQGRKLAIKAALLNQSLLSGVGNIYADESLFQAGIRPGRRAGRLTKAELERLCIALRGVLEHAVRLGGSSISDYVNAEGEPGLFQIEHCVYRRTGQPCPRCGRPIRRILIAGRGTHFCSQCQR